MASRKFSILIVLSLIICLTTSLFYLQRTLNQVYIKEKTVEDLKYLPSGQFLKGAALSFDQILADLFWIKLISYYGRHSKTDHKYKWLGHLVTITTILDPLYEDPYEFGGTVLALESGTSRESNRILLDGLANVPSTHKRYWRLNFYLAFNYMYYDQDYLLAAQHLEQAAKSPGSPEYLPLLVSRLYANANDPRIAISFLKEMLQQTDSEEFKQKLQHRIKEIKSDYIIRQLEAARDIYVQKKGHLPLQLEDLVRERLIAKVPIDPLGGTFSISAEGGTISSSKMNEKLKLYLN